MTAEYSAKEFQTKWSFLQRVGVLEEEVPMKYRLYGFYAATSELGRYFQYIGSYEN